MRLPYREGITSVPESNCKGKAEGCTGHKCPSCLLNKWDFTRRQRKARSQRSAGDQVRHRARAESGTQFKGWEQRSRQSCSPGCCALDVPPILLLGRPAPLPKGKLLRRGSPLGPHT